MINFRTSEWRSQQISKHNKIIMPLLGCIDNFELDKQAEWYSPEIEDAYFIFTQFQSTKVPMLQFIWSPLLQTFTRAVISIEREYRGLGLGTFLTDATEEIAIQLGAQKVIFSGVVEASRQYWSQKAGYKLVRNDAIRILDEG